MEVMELTEKLNKAFGFMMRYYNKILEVDLNTLEYDILRINEQEAKAIPGDINFLDWVTIIGENYISKEDQDDYFRFMNPCTLRRLTKPTSTFYRKKIDGNWHDVFVEIVPYELGKIYIFIKDWSMLDG